MSNKRLKAVIEGYQKAYKKYGVDARALQYWSGKWARLRYEEITADADFKEKAILDVGCGFADILPYIEKKAKNFKYSGVDVVPEFVEVAKNKYPKHKFAVRDYFGMPYQRDFDIILTSGTLNANIKGATKYRKKAIKTMYEHAKAAVIFNMAGSFPQPKNMKRNRVYYANSLEILNFCLKFTPKIIYRGNYHPKDFTVLMYK